MSTLTSILAYVESERRQSWLWQPPPRNPCRAHIAPVPPVVTPPHIPKQHHKAFPGIKFKIGASKT